MTETIALAEAQTLETETILRLQVRRVIHAERARVYAAWTQPELMAQWFAPGNMTCPNVTADPRPGGAYRVEMAGAMDDSPGQSPNATVTAAGSYVEIVPGELLKYTWTGSWAPEEETVITVEFKDADGGTEITLTHERFDSIQSKNGHLHGWELALPKLARLLEK